MDCLAMRLSTVRQVFALQVSCHSTDNTFHFLVLAVTIRDEEIPASATSCPTGRVIKVFALPYPCVSRETQKLYAPVLL